MGNRSLKQSGTGDMSLGAKLQPLYNWYMRLGQWKTAIMGPIHGLGQVYVCLEDIVLAPN